MMNPLEIEGARAMASIFISYRREDSSGYTGRLHDRFIQRWGRQRVFMDIDNIDPGEDFLEVIDRTLAQCAVLVVVIGPRWLTTTNSAGRRKVDTPSDYHRMEVEAGLKRGIRVIPVLVGGADMPSEEDLPEPLKPFARRNASEVSDKRFDFDVGKLIDAIERALTAIEQRDAPSPHPPATMSNEGSAPEQSVRSSASRSVSEPAVTGQTTGFVQTHLSQLKVAGLGAVVLLAVVGFFALRQPTVPTPVDVSPPPPATAPSRPPETAPANPPQAAPTTPDYSGPAIAMRGQNTFPKEWAHSEAVNDLARLLSATTSGRIKLEVLPAGAVVPAFGAMDAVRQGTLDFTWVSPGSFYGKDTAFALVEGAPFGPNATEYVRWRRDSAVRSAVDALYRVYGVHGISCGVVGPYADLWSTRAIRNPSDLKGLPMRVVGIRLDVFTAAGAAVNALPGGEVVPAFDRGIIKAAHFLDPATSAQAGLQEVAKFMYYPGTITPAIGLDLIVNAEKWDALPRDAQAALVRACDRIAQEMLERNPAAQRRAFSALSKASVESARLPGPVVDALRSAWQKVAAEKSSNPTFRKLLESARPYASG